MPLLEELKKKLLGEDEPVRERVRRAETQKPRGSELVGPGPVPPFRTMKEKAKAEIDTGVAAYKDLEDRPAMTREKFKQTLELAKKGSKEAKSLLERLQVEDIEKKDADRVYDTYFKMKDK